MRPCPPLREEVIERAALLELRPTCLSNCLVYVILKDLTRATKMVADDFTHAVCNHGVSFYAGVYPVETGSA